MSLEVFKKYFELDYNCPSCLRWIDSSSKHRKDIIGTEAGSFHQSSGYFNVKLKGKVYRAHRIVYSLANEEELLPNDFIDHIDYDRSNTHPSNLRKATRSENGCNRSHNSNNKLKIKNISENKNGTFLVQIRKDGKRFAVNGIESLELAELIADEVRETIHKNFSRK